ncbi:hypothetical protein NIES4073_14360 [Kalymmatonema gypsitolerans NIES-4073]|nr:hypothetical protein NIES4073_14360 [Scytonema sp. NIES-4073]
MRWGKPRQGAPGRTRVRVRFPSAPLEAIASVSALVFSTAIVFIRIFFEKLFFLNQVLGKNPLRLRVV